MKIRSSVITGSNLLPEHAVILDIASRGRYWRSSPLISVSLISSKAGLPEEITWISGKESDEYDILEALREYLTGHDTVITFGLAQRDLFREYRSLRAVLGLPSGKLADYDAYIRIHAGQKASPSSENEELTSADAKRTLRILGFDAVLELLGGDFDSAKAEVSEDLVIFRIRTLRDMPCRIAFHDGPFHLTAAGRTAALSSRIEDGKIRFYHDDIRNYVYLPHEGYAIYRTMAEFVDRSHREKATRENCYTYAFPAPAFLEDPEQVRIYVKAALIYLGSRR